MYKITKIKIKEKSTFGCALKTKNLKLKLWKQLNLMFRSKQNEIHKKCLSELNSETNKN